MNNELNEKFLKWYYNESNFDWVKYNVSPAEEFIYLKFMQCRLITGSDGWTEYIDSNGKVLFIDNIETGDEEKVLYFDYGTIYIKLWEMGLDYKKIKALVKDMLWEVHKRKVDTTHINFAV